MACYDYLEKQADILMKQWAFYENLTWRIPSMTITVSGGLFVLFRLFGQTDQRWLLPIGTVFVGMMVLVNAHRLYRASRLCETILQEVKAKFDREPGIENIKRSTGDLEWSWYTNFSSRILTCRAIFLWGVGLVFFGIGLAWDFI